MTDWLGEVNRVLGLARQKDWSTIRGQKDIIFGVWELMNSADDTARDFYRSYSETEIASGASQLDLDAALADFTAPVRSAAERRAVFKELAIRLRALENHYYAEHNGMPSKSSHAFHVEFDGRHGYFLDWAPRGRVPHDRSSFEKRALVRSRILPRKIGPADLRIYVLDDPRGALRAMREETSAKFGAGLFERLDFSMLKGKDGFIVEKVICEGQSATIAAQLQDATSEACSGVVYPELTIAGDVLGEVCTLMSDGAHEIELSLIVAGSRHVKGDDGLVRNTATIIDGYGERAVEQSKFFRFTDGANPSEAIEPATELAVIVLGDTVLACAICLDFCHLTTATPYDDLDVDYILVPSCGEGKTMASHIEKARSILRKRAVDTLIVQQFHDGLERIDTNPLGYILSPSTLAGATSASSEVRQPWSIVAV